MDKLKLLIDIGSTFTKVAAVDVNEERVLATSKSPSTVKEDVTIGLRRALAIVEEQIGRVDGAEILACSSAAGGLRMVSIGLVPELSCEAAKRAALGAGAKIVGHHSHQLTRREVKHIEETRPDIVLLAGGTDGGDDVTIMHNADMLSGASITAPIVVAGNKCAYDRIENIFRASDKTVKFVDNVMPEIGRLEVQACREAIREVFMENIVKAKGLDKAKALANNIIMATPAAVLNAATLLCTGAEDEPGLGELIVVDVGGATTDVYSAANGTPTGVAMVRGLPEPFAKRTVEGDLGVRHNIDTLLKLLAERGVSVDHESIALFRANPEKLPQNEKEWAADMALARVAVETSFERHTGRIEIVYGSMGETIIQVGKDLSAVARVIGTGGPIVYSIAPEKVLRGVLAGSSSSGLLKPKRADFFVDTDYIMYAMGLLAMQTPGTAVRMLKKGLKKV
jgi:uncharacterized protein (TIGR01319 family)